MPGRLRASFRSGNLAEHLGLLLLRGVAAIADVPRTEDIGLDAVATLLRRDADGNHYAEDGFGVQLKSFSEQRIDYSGHALSWLLGQTQPMFIGRVSLKDSRIALYSTLHVNQAVLALHRDHITVEFGLASHAMGNLYPWAGGDHRSATVWLGDPILEWALSDLTDKAWAISAYETLKRFLCVARQELELLALGQCSELVWATNSKDSIKSSFKMSKGHVGDLPAVAQHLLPVLNSLLSCATVLPQDQGSSLMVPALALIAALRDHGIDVKPSEVFCGFASLHVQENAVTCSKKA